MTYRKAGSRYSFTHIPNDIINENSLSMRARFLLIWLLSKPDHWEVNSEYIASQFKEGRDAIRTALKELEEAGYLVRRKEQDERGHWKTYTDIYSEPTTDSQASVSRSSVTQAPIVTTDIVNTDKKNLSPTSQTVDPVEEWIEQRLQEHPEWRERVKLYQNKPSSYRQKVVQDLVDKQNQKSLRSLQGDSPPPPHRRAPLTEEEKAVLREMDRQARLKREEQERRRKLHYDTLARQGMGVRQ